MGKTVATNSEQHAPRMMTVREVATTGILPGNTIRVMLKDGRIPAIYIGRKALIDCDALCDQLEELRGGDECVKLRLPPQVAVQLVFGRTQRSLTKNCARS